jgi:hypothetical protein
MSDIVVKTVDQLICELSKFDKSLPVHCCFEQEMKIRVSAIYNWNPDDGKEPIGVSLDYHEEDED